jgi:putative SOS response-associated peptidase YedK
MCGRFVTPSSEEAAEAFDLTAGGPVFGPRYNVAPSQPVPVVALKADGITRGLALIKWG